MLLAVIAAMRSVLAEIRASGAPIELLPSMLSFDTFLDFIGVGEIRELEQRFADQDNHHEEREKR
jgi:2,3-dimethylmalate lyase